MGVEALPPLEMAPTADQDLARPEGETLRQPAGWDPENFAREQIRGLVRQVFFVNAAHPVRQAVFSPLEPDTDMPDLCRRVGEALALQTSATVAVVGEYPRLLQGADTQRAKPPERAIQDGGMPLRQIAARVRGNLWLVPDQERGENSLTTVSLHSYLGEVRRQFEYSIVQAPRAGESDAATAMAQVADGIILVLSAHRTRRAAARQIKAELEAAQVRILGTVLSDRMFPIPEAIYRRL
jgi:hypothetical protein